MSNDSSSTKPKASAISSAAKKYTRDGKMTTTTTKSNVTVGTLEDAKNSERSDNSDKESDNYVYCDFAQIEEEEYDVDYEIDQEGLLQALEESTAMAAAQTMQHQTMAYASQPQQVLRASGWVRSQRFPVKLYALLSQPQLSHIITWMPHGRSWKVLKPRIFETAVLPVFFESDNYHSFNRVINAWSFRRKSCGPDRGSYFHELFLRGKPHLQKYMRRLPRTHKKLSMTKEEEPDFFELEKTSPLPTLEQAKVQLERRKMGRLREHFEKDTVVKGVPSFPSRTPADRAVAEMNALKQVEIMREQEYGHEQTLKAIQMHDVAQVQANQAARVLAASDQELELRAREVLARERELQFRLQQQNHLDFQHRAEQDLKDRLDRMEGKLPMRSLVDVDLMGYELDPRASAIRQVETEALRRRHQQEQYLASQYQQQRLMLHASAEDPHERFLRGAHAIRQAELLREEQQLSGPPHPLAANSFMRQAHMARQLDKIHAAQSQSAAAAVAAAAMGYPSSAASYGGGSGPMSPLNPMGNPYL